MHSVGIPTDGITRSSRESEHQFWDNPCCMFLFPTKIFQKVKFLKIGTVWEKEFKIQTDLGFPGHSHLDWKIHCSFYKTIANLFEEVKEVLLRCNTYYMKKCCYPLSTYKTAFCWVVSARCLLFHHCHYNKNQWSILKKNKKQNKKKQNRMCTGKHSGI